MSLKVLSISCDYPNPNHPTRGLFVQSRVRSTAAHAEVKVVAPVPLLDYRGAPQKASIPLRHHEGPMEVFHPRWFYPPGGTVLNPLFLAGRLLWPLWRLRKRFDFEVLDAHFGYPTGVAAALLSMVLKCPFVVTLRGSELLHARRDPARSLIAWALRRAAAIVAVSDELRDLAVQLGGDPARSTTISNGVDSSIFFMRDRRQSRRDLSLPEDGLLLLMVGHLIELKGHRHVIQALSRLRERGLNATLLIVGGAGSGGPSSEPQLRELASSLGLQDQVRFLGEANRDKLPLFMSAADVFCLASSREGWPNAVHEALACGTPVVATRVGSIAQLIPLESFGYIVPHGDAAALENKLADAFHTAWDRQAISSWGRGRSWEKVGAEVAELLAHAARSVAK